MATLNISPSTGSSGIYVNGASWANLRAGTGSTSFNLTNFVIDAAASSEMGRGFAFFSLSGIPVGAIINSVTLRIPAVGNKNSSEGGTVYVTSHTSNDPITASAASWQGIQYNNNYGNLAVASFSTGANNDISLTATGIANLITANIGGTAKIAIIHSSDYNNSAPASTDQFTAEADNWTLIVDYSVSEGSTDSGNFYFM